MNKKGILLCSLFAILLTILVVICFYYEEGYTEAHETYQVYLDGEKIGLIESKDKLYELINEEQVSIKEEYKVDQVYPPKGFNIIKTRTYDEKVSTVKEVYEQIKEEKNFTIKGYTITIKSETEGVEPIYIYTLDDTLFEKAATNVVHTFVGEDRYNAYLTNTQPEIVDTGSKIEQMLFEDKITIKESYISVEEKIYKTEEELTKYLLFSENISNQEYKVVQGDTLEKIAEQHRLNIDELLIANDALDSEDTLLAIGQTLNVALINPVLSLVYDELVVEDVERMYQSVVQEDPNQYTDYSKVIQEGAMGIDRVT